MSECGSEKRSILIRLQHTPTLTDQPNNAAVGSSSAVQVKETKVIYHIDEEETPYLVKIVQDGDDVSGPVRLRDFKSVLPSHLQRLLLTITNAFNSCLTVRREDMSETKFSLCLTFRGLVILGIDFAVLSLYNFVR